MQSLYPLPPQATRFTDEIPREAKAVAADPSLEGPRRTGPGTEAATGRGQGMGPTPIILESICAFTVLNLPPQKLVPDSISGHLLFAPPPPLLKPDSPSDPPTWPQPICQGTFPFGYF